MTLAELIHAARAHHAACIATGNVGLLSDDVAAAVLALLAVEKPCSFDADDAVQVSATATVDVALHVGLTADEARWLAARVLDAADRADVAQIEAQQALADRCGGGWPGGIHRYTDRGRIVRCPVCGGTGYRGGTESYRKAMAKETAGNG